MRRKTKLSFENVLPPGSEIPDGYMLFYRRIVRVADVENHVDEQMRGFDNLPPDVRAAINEVPLSPQEAGALVARHGANAARIILTKYRDKLNGRRT
jgi:hypothetical protein